jgi:hypothetical protein
MRSRPLRTPVHIRVKRRILDERGKKLHGECGLIETKSGGARFEIDLARGPIDVMVETLVHEWAHCLAWKRFAPVRRWHGLKWGKAYSRAYCAGYRVTD